MIKMIKMITGLGMGYTVIILIIFFIVLGNVAFFRAKARDRKGAK